MKWIGVGLGVVAALVLLAAGALWLRNYPWPVEPERVTIRSGEIEFFGVLLKPEGEAPISEATSLSRAMTAPTPGFG